MPSASAGSTGVAGLGAPTGDPVVYAHRGAAGLAPENTLGAFRQTHAAYGDRGVWLELDTQLTADGHLIVLHDDTLDRTTDCGGAVNTHPLSYVQTCDASEIFPGWGQFEAVPTLHDVLVEGRDAGWRLMIELKNIPLEANFDILGTKAADALLAEVGATGFPTDRLQVQSFWPLSIDRIEAKAPHIATVFLTSAALPGLPDGLGVPVLGNVLLGILRGYEITSPETTSIDLNATTVAIAHLLGRKVVPYTPDTAGDIARVVAMGVDGVITNRPDVAYDLLD